MASSDFDRLANRLRGMSRRPTVPQQREARRAGLQPVVGAAKEILEAHGNRVSGKYIASLGVGEKDRQASSAGPIAGKPHASLGVLLEFGTAPHWQPNRNGGQMHPGAQPFPHMRPAYDMMKGQVVATLGRAIIGSIFGKTI